MFVVHKEYMDFQSADCSAYVYSVRFSNMMRKKRFKP